jgi:glycosyltransferase involved in cell wall biosynthesis
MNIDKTGRQRLLLVYFIDKEHGVKYRTWNDGFVAAMNLVSETYSVEWFNLADRDIRLIRLDDYSAVLAKGNWGGRVDAVIRAALSGVAIPKALLISGSRPPPELSRMLFYKVLFYETEWYRPQIEAHPCIFHAFGVHTDIMKPAAKNSLKIYDWLTVGSLWEIKRLDYFAKKPGKKLAILYLGGGWRKWLKVLRLMLRGVRVKSYMPYDKLAEHYQGARGVYIPAKLQGGGERAVLEARACGVPVEVEPDNPKLIELLNTPLWDHRYYAQQLMLGISKLLMS